MKNMLENLIPDITAETIDIEALPTVCLDVYVSEGSTIMSKMHINYALLEDWFVIHDLMGNSEYLFLHFISGFEICVRLQCKVGELDLSYIAENLKDICRDMTKLIKEYIYKGYISPPKTSPSISDYNEMQVLSCFHRNKEKI